MFDKYYLYWIHRKCHTDMTKEGYIGVTFNCNRRFIQHKSNANKGYRSYLYNALKKYNDIIFTVLCVGSVDYILNCEKKLRSKPNIGWNIAIGGDTNFGYLKTPLSIVKQAETSTKPNRLTFLNIWVDYFEKGMLRKEIQIKYNLGQWTVWNIISGNTKAYPDLKDTYRVLKANRVFNSTHVGSLPEDLYDEILRGRESGKTYIELSDMYQIPSRTIREYCIGKVTYLKRFSCYRVAENPNSKKYTYKGKSQNLGAWASDLGLKYGTLHARLNKGWSIEKAFETLVDNPNRAVR